MNTALKLPEIGSEYELDNLTEKMLAFADKYHLPVKYREDIAQDCYDIQRYKGKQCIWLLHTSGTVLVPIECGVNSVSVTYWTMDQINHDLEVVALLVDTKTNAITEISKETANELIKRLPYHDLIHSDRMYLLQSNEAIAIKNKVIEHGVKNGFWSTPSSKAKFTKTTLIREMYEYFEMTGNREMKHFLAHMTKRF